MRIGITGSAGFLGANLLKHLCEQAPDQQIVPFFSRRTSNPINRHLRLEYRHLDVTSRQEVLRSTRGLDLLFHLAGMIDYSRKHLRRTWDVNVLGAENIFQAVLENGIGKLVFISSISVLGPPASAAGLADETNQIYGHRSNPISFSSRESTLAAVRASRAGDYSFLAGVRVPYFDSKLAAYELALELRRRHDLPVVVVFPGTAVGAGDVGYSISRLIDLVFTNRLRFALPGGTSFVSVSDLSEGLRLAGRQGAVGESYIITGPEGDNLSYRAFMKLVAKVARTYYNRRISDKFIVLPAVLSALLARAARDRAARARAARAGAARGLLAESGLNEGLLLSGSVTHRFTHRKASRELGYQPGSSLESAIRECIDFQLRYGGETDR